MRTVGLLAFLSVFSGASGVAAAPVTFDLEGVVTQVVFPSNLDGSVTVGTPFVGSYSFDPLTPNVSSDPRFAAYEAISFRVVVGGYEFRSLASGADVSIGITNGPDSYGLGSLENEAVGFFPPPPGQRYDSLLRMQWLLTGGNPLSSTALPGTPPDLGEWTGNSLIVSADKGLVGDGVFDIYGRVTSIVPEPKPGQLLLTTVASLALAAALVRRRTRTGSHFLLLALATGCLGAISAAPTFALAQSAPRDM